MALNVLAKHLFGVGLIVGVVVGLVGFTVILMAAFDQIVISKEPVERAVCVRMSLAGVILILLKEQDIRGDHRIGVIFEGGRREPVGAQKSGPLHHGPADQRIFFIHRARRGDHGKKPSRPLTHPKISE